MLGIGIVLSLWLACGSEETTVTSSQSLQACEVNLYNRWAQDSLPLHADSVLAALLPEKLSGYQFTGKQGSTYQGAKRGFAEAESGFQNPNNKVLRFQLRDYAQDTAALHALWREYTHAAKGQSPHPFAYEVKQYGGCDDVFVWLWADKRNGFSYLEAVAYGRYHVTISTDHSEQDSELQTAWNGIVWEDWEMLGVVPQKFMVEL